MNSQESRNSNTNKPLKVALAHDFLLSYGGAERVFQAMAEMFPDAPIYTLLADQKIIAKHFPNRDIRVSWLSRLPNFLKKHYRFFLPFFPVAVESFDLRDFDIVISSSGAWSKGIITRLNTKHIAYLHSPMRYAWDYHNQYLDELSPYGKLRIFTRMLISYLRVWDRQAAERPDVLLVNSQFTQARVKKYYRRESEVIYPGALELYEKTKKIKGQDGSNERRHFLVVSRLTRSKKVAYVVEAFNKLGLPLIIAGVGPERPVFEKLAKKNVHFVGFVDDNKLAELYAGARALIFPAEEDFGMVAAEALSFGVPVIAYEYGGIREIVIPEKTGELFSAQTPEVLAEGIRRFLAREGQYDETMMKKSVAYFTKENFQNGIKNVVEKLCS
jgi:glycosyltransferase involved in cell wall biosynthesis